MILFFVVVFILFSFRLSAASAVCLPFGVLGQKATQDACQKEEDQTKLFNYSHLGNIQQFAVADKQEKDAQFASNGGRRCILCSWCSLQAIVDTLASGSKESYHDELVFRAHDLNGDIRNITGF